LFYRYVQQCMAMRNRHAVCQYLRPISSSGTVFFPCGINTSRSPTNILALASFKFAGKGSGRKKMYLTCANALSWQGFDFDSTLKLRCMFPHIQAFLRQTTFPQTLKTDSYGVATRCRH
jgi:hypothetical protein